MDRKGAALMMVAALSGTGMNAGIRFLADDLHAVRGVVNAATMLMFYAGVALTSLAKVSALTFSGPLLATLLAVVALGEVIRVRRTITLGVGFLDAWIILRPGVVPLESGALLVLG